MKRKKFQISSRNLFDNQSLLLVIIFALSVTVFGVVEENFLSGRSIASMAIQLPEIGILSLAMIVPVMIGGINLSITATANLSAILAVFFIQKFLIGGNPALVISAVIFVAVLTGIVTGLFNGFLVGVISAPPILATLASMGIFTGLAVGLTKGSTLTGFDTSIGWIASASLLGIPLPFLVFVAVSAVVYLLLNQTTFGFNTRMMGTNPVAANFSGIHNKSLILRDFVFSGVLASIAGVLIMSRSLSASYMYGSSTYVMLTLLIYVLAGVTSGAGNVFNVFITVLILQVISTGFHMLLAGVRGSAFFKDFVWGMLLILILVSNALRQRAKNGE